MQRDRLRWVVGGLLSFLALNAFGGGYYGMSGAPGVPREWLAGSPFRDYFIPGLFLFVVIGGAFLTAGIAVFARAAWRRLAVAISVALVFAWLAIQVAIIGYVSWMQPATAVAAAVAAALARSTIDDSKRAA